MGSVDLEKAFHRVPLRVLWGMLRKNGGPDPLQQAIRSLYACSESCVCILGNRSDTPHSKPVDRSHQVGPECLPQAKEFKYLRVLFTSEGKTKRKIDRRIGAAAVGTQALHQTVLVRRELSRKAKLPIYRSVPIRPSPIDPHL